MNELDIKMMLALNFDGGGFMDAVMWFASGIPNWIPLYLLVMFLIYRKYGWKYMLFAVLFMAAGVGICDQVCNIFKRNIEYLRPTHTEGLLPYLHTVKGYVGGRYGTVSGHASTSLFVCLFASLVMKKRWVTAVMVIYTVLVSYSRIYLGVHFPFQILFGWMLGAIVAVLLWWLFSVLNKKFLWNSVGDDDESELCAEAGV